MTTVPPPIQRMIDATNSADSDAFVACFSEDAYLEDWGRTFRGHDGVRAWDASDNIGKHSRMVATDVRADGDDVIVTVTVTGQGFQGSGPIRFHIEEDRITRLVITPH